METWMECNYCLNYQSTFMYSFNRISIFFLFLWICRYTHAANGTCSRWVGAGGSNHKYKSPTIPLICYFGISLHIRELLEVFSSSVILRSHLILPEMLLPWFWWFSGSPWPTIYSIILTTSRTFSLWEWKINQSDKTGLKWQGQFSNR